MKCHKNQFCVAPVITARRQRVCRITCWCLYQSLYYVRTKDISFGTKYFIFQFAVQEYKELYVQNHNFVYCFFTGVKLDLSLWGCSRIGWWKRYSGLGGMWYEGNGEDYIKRSFVICTLHQILLEWLHEEERGGRGMGHVWWRVEMHKGFYWGSPRERDHLENKSLDGRIILKRLLQK
jgi:hypothetical protein